MRSGIAKWFDTNILKIKFHFKRSQSLVGQIKHDLLYNWSSQSTIEFLMCSHQPPHMIDTFQEDIHVRRLIILDISLLENVTLHLVECFCMISSRLIAKSHSFHTCVAMATFFLFYPWVHGANGLMMLIFDWSTAFGARAIFDRLENCLISCNVIDKKFDNLSDFFA